MNELHLTMTEIIHDQNIGLFYVCANFIFAKHEM